MSALIFAFCSMLHGTYGNWFAPRYPNLFRYFYCGAAGEYNGTIYLFGGLECCEGQLMRYEIDQGIFIDDGENATNVSTWGYGQFYAQIDQFLYTISPNGDKINIYNMKTNAYEHNSYQSIPINVGTWAV